VRVFGLFIYLIDFHILHLGTYHGNGKSQSHNTSSGSLQLDITNIRLEGVHNNYSPNLHKSTLYVHKMLKDCVR
jgi:hypothetical protein